MYKQKSSFVEGIRKGSFDKSIIAGHPLIETQGYSNKNIKKIDCFKLTLKELRRYASSLSLECSGCEHSRVIRLDELIKIFGHSNTINNLKNKFVCGECNSKQFVLNVTN
jgi:hypothetical protein